MREKEEPSKNFVRCRQEIDNLVLCKKEEPSKNFVRWRREREIPYYCCARTCATQERQTRVRNPALSPACLQHVEPQLRISKKKSREQKSRNMAGKGGTERQSRENTQHKRKKNNTLWSKQE